MPDYSKDPDALHDDAVIYKIEIAIRRNGAMSVAGSINEDWKWLWSVLDEAKAVIRRHHDRQATQLIVPASDMPVGSA